MVDLRDLIGVKFVSGGRDVGTGLDCWGLAMEIYRRYGMELPDFVVDSFAFQIINQMAWEEIQSRKWEQVEEPRNGGAPLVVLMRIHPKYVNHVGVYTGGGRIMHTRKDTGVIISGCSQLRQNIEGFYRLCSQ